jgi:lysophospholipase L1-like esterase
LISRARRTGRRLPSSSFAALLLSGALLAVALSGCSDSSATPAGPTTTDNGLPSLVLIGDSITHRSADVLMDTLSDRFNVTIVADDGRTIAEQQVGASDAALSSPDYVFINLGTNDAVKGVSLADAEKGLIDMAAKFPDACVAFATINKNTTIPVYNAKASALNDFLFANAKHIADWNATVTKGYMQRQPVVLDGLHPNEDGKAQYAQIISDALDTCPTRAPGP